MIAKEKGLEPLLQKILEGSTQINDLVEVAKDFVTPADANIEPALKVALKKKPLPVLLTFMLSASQRRRNSCPRSWHQPGIRYPCF